MIFKPFSALVVAVAFQVLLLQTVCFADDHKNMSQIKVLLVDGQNNHDWKRCSPVMIDTLQATGRFEIERAIVTKEEIATFKPDFDKYDVILSNYNGEPWMEETKRSFVQYMKGGGIWSWFMLRTIHFPNGRSIMKMIGLGGWKGRNEKDGPYVYWEDGKIVRDTSKGRGGSHGKGWEYKVVVREKKHPITRGLPTEFLMVKEELYDRLRGSRQEHDGARHSLCRGWFRTARTRPNDD